MPFDGLTMHALTEEIRAIALDSKIDKIHQPESDEIVLHLRKNKNNYTLLLSSDSNLPYFNLVTHKKQNPITAPMFCMLLRKHIGGGRIIGFDQLELERVLVITVASKDELGNDTEKRIVFEIMGKHSNISLIDEADKIIDCIKRIPIGVNRYRQLFPGITYLYPPNDKQDPRHVDLEKFNQILDGDLPVFKALYMACQGFSPIVAKEICLNSMLDPNLSVDQLNQDQMADLYQATKLHISTLLQGKTSPQVIYQEGFGIKDLTLVDLSPYETGYEINYFDNVIEMVNGYYGNKNTVNKALQRSYHLRKSIQGKIDRLKKKLKYLQKDLKQAEKADQYKVKGELILAYMYAIEKGQKQVSLENFYDNQKLITIDLDDRLSPSDNAQVYFKKYNKFKTAQVKVKEQMAISEAEILYLDQVLTLAEHAEDENAVEAIKEELILSGYLRRKQKHKKQKKLKNPPHQYKTSDGYTVLVGKNNIQNDELTFKLSSKTDLWLHTKDIPGSHVILKCNNQEPTDTAIQEAAMIAAYHSKGQTSSQVPVDYTPIKQVKKISGGKPGMVIFHTNKTLYVTPKEQEVLALRVK